MKVLPKDTTTLKNSITYGHKQTFHKAQNHLHHHHHLLQSTQLKIKRPFHILFTKGHFPRAAVLHNVRPSRPARAGLKVTPPKIPKYPTKKYFHQIWYFA
jgi:hypothetical protein